jgi:hypothetical protein
MYGCNVLNLGNSRIISVNPASARRIVKDPHFKGDVQVELPCCSLVNTAAADCLLIIQLHTSCCMPGSDAFSADQHRQPLSENAGHRFLSHHVDVRRGALFQPGAGGATGLLYCHSRPTLPPNHCYCSLLNLVVVPRPGDQAHQGQRLPAVDPDQRRAAAAVAAKGTAGDSGPRSVSRTGSNPRHATHSSAATVGSQQGVSEHGSPASSWF